LLGPNINRAMPPIKSNSGNPSLPIMCGLP
jgi:hypothetical protein